MNVEGNSTWLKQARGRNVWSSRYGHGATHLVKSIKSTVGRQTEQRTSAHTSRPTHERRSLTGNAQPFKSSSETHNRRSHALAHVEITTGVVEMLIAAVSSLKAPISSRSPCHNVVLTNSSCSGRKSFTEGFAKRYTQKHAITGTTNLGRVISTPQPLQLQ